MNNLIPLAYHYHYGYGGGWTDWLGHMAISAVVHALIYSLIFRLMHDLTFGQAAVLVVIVLVALFMWGRSRDRRGW
jgi:hypothetical protein